MLVMGPEWPGKFATLVRSCRWGLGNKTAFTGQDRKKSRAYQTPIVRCPIYPQFLDHTYATQTELGTPLPSPEITQGLPSQLISSFSFGPQMRPACPTFKSQILIWESMVPVPKMRPSGWNCAQVRAEEREEVCSQEFAGE